MWAYIGLCMYAYKYRHAPKYGRTDAVKWIGIKQGKIKLYFCFTYPRAEDESSSSDHTVPTVLEWCMFVRLCVRPPINARSHTANKRLDLERQARICMLTKYLRLSIFIEIVNVLGLNFKGQYFVSDTLTSTYVKST